MAATSPPQLLALGRPAEHVQAVLDLDVLDLAEVAVDVLDERAHVVGPLRHAEVGLQVGRLDGGPDPRGERRELAGVEHLQARVLVEQRLEVGELVVRLGAHHGRHEVVDDDRVRPPLRLDALARVVHDERVDERDVAEGGVRRAAVRQGEHLPGQPLQRPVLAQVHDRVGAPDGVEPAVAGEVVVGRREPRVVVDADRVLPVAARRLDGEQRVAELQARHDQVAVLDVLVARRRAPPLLDRGAQRLGERPVPAQVVVDRHPQRRGRELGVGEELGIVAARVDQRPHELVAVGVGLVGDDPRGREGLEQGDGARRRVQPDGVPHAGVAGREARQQDRDPPPRRRRRAQPGRAHREPGHPGAALRVGAVAGDGRADGALPFVALLERDHAAEHPPVEFGDGHLRRGVERGEARVGRRPGRPGHGGADGLDHRDAERGEGARVPVLPGLPDTLAAAGPGVRRPRAAGGQHGRDERVDVPVQQRERRHASVGVPPQRVAPDRQRVPPGRLDGRAEGVDEARVARQAVRAVEADPDGRPPGPVRREGVLEGDVATAGHVDPEVWHRPGLGEAEALQEEGVGEEAEQLLDVVHVAVAQVLRRLGDRARRRERQPGQLGVGLELAAQREERDALPLAPGSQQVEAVAPAAPAAEDAAEDDPRAGEDVADQGRRVLGGGRVGAADLGEAGRQALHRRRGCQDLRVRGRDEAYHADTRRWSMAVSSG